MYFFALQSYIFSLYLTQLLSNYNVHQKFASENIFPGLLTAFLLSIDLN